MASCESSNDTEVNEKYDVEEHEQVDKPSVQAASCWFKRLATVLFQSS